MPDVNPSLNTPSQASLHVIVPPIVAPIVEWRVFFCSEPVREKRGTVREQRLSCISMASNRWPGQSSPVLTCAPSFFHRQLFRLFVSIDCPFLIYSVTTPQKHDATRCPCHCYGTASSDGCSRCVNLLSPSAKGSATHSLRDSIAQPRQRFA